MALTEQDRLERTSRGFDIYRNNVLIGQIKEQPQGDYRILWEEGYGLSSQSLNTTDSPTFAGLTVGSVPFFPLHSALVTLTDEQIKGLPTTAVPLASAPGSNRMILLVQGIVRPSITDPYTNISADSAIRLIYTGTGSDLTNTTAFLDLSDGTSYYLLPRVVQLEGSATNAMLNYTFGGDPPEKGVSILAFNTDGDFTGGNAANTILVSIAYLVLNLTTGLFE